MIAITNLNEKSVNLLKNRGLSDQQVNKFSELLTKAHEQQQNNVSAKQVISNMSAAELQLLQKATSLANRIDAGSLTKEGAMNLLAQPDTTGMVDLNNDGVVEIGEGKRLVFPPVNAPAYVKNAWDEATKDLSEQDKMMLELHSHILTYGVIIDGQPTKEALPPSEQWSPANIIKWLTDARAALEFSVEQDGWSHFNQVQRDFYNDFEQALGVKF